MMCLPQVGYVPNEVQLKTQHLLGSGQAWVAGSVKGRTWHPLPRMQSWAFCHFVWRLSEWSGFGERGNVVSRRAGWRLQPDHECQVFKCLRLMGNVSCKP